MKKLRFLTRRLALAAMAACLVAGVGSRAGAVVLWDDAFTLKPTGDYNTGVLGGQSGGTGSFFTGPWVQPGGDDTQVLPTSLSKPGLIYPPVGGSAGGVDDTVGTGNQETSRTFRTLATPWGSGRTPPSGTFYISMLANYGTSTDGNPQHRTLEMYNSDGTTGDGPRSVMLGYSTFAGLGTTLTLYGKDQTSGNESFKPLAENLSFANDGMTHCIVMRFDLSGGAGTDAISVYLDAMGTTEPAVPSAKITAADMTGGVFNLDVINFSPMSQFSFGNNLIAPKYDALRVGTTFADVACMSKVPEPTTIGMLLVGAIGLMVIRKR